MNRDIQIHHNRSAVLAPCKANIMLHAPTYLAAAAATTSYQLLADGPTMMIAIMGANSGTSLLVAICYRIVYAVYEDGYDFTVHHGDSSPPPPAASWGLEAVEFANGPRKVSIRSSTEQ